MPGEALLVRWQGRSSSFGSALEAAQQHRNADGNEDQRPPASKERTEVRQQPEVRKQEENPENYQNEWRED